MMMFALLFSGVHHVNAQKEAKQELKYQFEVGIGVWSTGNIIYTLSDMVVETVNIHMRNSSASGTFHAGIKYLLSDRLSAGATLSYGQEKADGYNGSNEFLGTLKRSNVSLAAEADFKYLGSNKFSIYGLVGIGGICLHQKFGSETDNKMNIDFQLTPIGVKFGDKFGGFGELGLGYKGILNVGVFLKM
jgi:opacity protein-like surface antigen